MDRIESEDFIHWSPKVRVINRTRLDQPLATVFYQMAPMPYEGVYVGLIAAYHSETLKEPPEDKPWVDRKNLHLAFSRNGVTWSRVGKHGAIPQRELSQDRDWKQVALETVFVPYGRKNIDWDWGTVSPYFTPDPIVVRLRHHRLGHALWQNVREGIADHGRELGVAESKQLAAESRTKALYPVQRGFCYLGRHREHGGHARQLPCRSLRRAGPGHQPYAHDHAPHRRPEQQPEGRAAQKIDHRHHRVRPKVAGVQLSASGYLVSTV